MDFLFAHLIEDKYGQSSLKVPNYLVIPYIMVPGNCIYEIRHSYDFRSRTNNPEVIVQLTAVDKREGIFVKETAKVHLQKKRKMRTYEYALYKYMQARVVARDLKYRPVHYYINLPEHFQSELDLLLPKS